MNTNEFNAVFAIASTVIMSFIYFLILDKMEAGKKEKTRRRITSIYIWRKISGLIILGGLPAIIAWVFFRLNPLDLGFKSGGTLDLWPWLAGASLLFIILNSFNSKSPDLQAIYPEMRLR